MSFYINSIYDKYLYKNLLLYISIIKNNEIILYHFILFIYFVIIEKLKQLLIKYHL